MEKIRKKFLGDLILALGSVVVILVFLWRGAILQGVFFGADEIASDLLQHSYPYHEFSQNYLKAGEIPLWNPYVGAGMPVFGEAQTGVFNPIAALIYYFLPATAAFNWLIITTFVFIALSTYFYARSIGIFREGAFLAGVAFALSGFMVGNLRHVPVIGALTFMPLMFFACEKIIARGRLFWGIFLAFLIFLSFSPGQLTTTYLLMFVLAGYFLVRLRFVFEEKKRENLRPFLVFFGAIVLGVLFSAVILLPGIEMIGYSNRAELSLESALSPVYKIKYLALFLVPYAFGDPSRATWDMTHESYWENIGYIGILPLILAAAGLYFGIFKKSTYIKSISLVLFFCFLLLLGNYTFLYRWVRDWIPGFSFTRISGRFLLYIDFFLAVSAGFGLKYVASYIKGEKRSVFIGGVILLSIIDLFHFGYNFNVVIPNSYFSQTNSVKFLKQDTDLFRYRSIGFENEWQKAWRNSGGWRGDLSLYMAQRELLPPDYNSVYKIATTGYIYGQSGRFGVKRPIDLDAAVLQSFTMEDKTRSAKLLGMENVKYLLSQTEIGSFADLEMVSKLPTDRADKTTYVYKNKAWLPRTYLVGRSLAITNPEEVLGTIIAGQFDPAVEVILEKNVRMPQTEGKGEVKVTLYRDSQVKIDVNSVDGGFLVLSDTFYPGWKATVDGTETEILRANYAYRAVYLEKGRHNVVFSFEPNSVWIGAYITFGTLVVILGIFIWDVKFFTFCFGVAYRLLRRWFWKQRRWRPPFC